MKITEEREKLENLLNEIPDNIKGAVPTPGNIPEELRSEPTMGINFTDLRSTCTDEARIMIVNAISFILPDEMSETQQKYVEEKLKVDIMSLSGMLYQVRANEAMQKAMMEEVDRGSIHPRMFEVFGQLSKTIADLNKQLLQTVEAIKATYKDIKSDAREQKNEALGPVQDTLSLTRGDGSMVTMGTKELIRSVKDRNKQDNDPRNIVEDVTPIN
jgi:hypothetical protein